MIRYALATMAALLLPVGVVACADEAAPDAETGPSFDLTISPLLLPGVTNVEYTVTIQNKSGDNITSQTFDSDTYGDGSGSARYLAPCDAASTEQPNKIKLEIDGVYTGSAQTLTDVKVPDLLVKESNCTENQSTTVSFDIYGVQGAGQGFFDILIGFENIYCSAKLDCTSAPAMFANANASLVLGLVCAAGNTSVEDTTLYMNNISIACGATGNATVDPSRAGNLPASYLDDPAELIDEVTVSRGEDSLAATDELFWNVAIGLTDAAVGATSCTLTAQATTAGGSLGATSPYTTLADYPIIDWNLTVVSAAALACTNHPIGGTGSQAGVAVDYPSAGSTSSYKHEYTGPQRYVFATAATYTPGVDFASLAQADSLCQRDALAAGLEGKYVAWMSDTSHDAKDRIASLTDYTLSDGTTVIANDVADLIDGTLDQAIAKDEAGSAVTGAVWTGTTSAGVAASDTCGDWAGTNNGAEGDATSATSTWTVGSSAAACTTAKHLYCFPAP